VKGEKTQKAESRRRKAGGDVKREK
jgi:hypothetical protein